MRRSRPDFERPDDIDRSFAPAASSCRSRLPNERRSAREAIATPRTSELHDFLQATAQQPPVHRIGGEEASRHRDLHHEPERGFRLGQGGT